MPHQQVRFVSQRLMHHSPSQRNADNRSTSVKTKILQRSRKFVVVQHSPHALVSSAAFVFLMTVSEFSSHFSSERTLGFTFALSRQGSEIHTNAKWIVFISAFTLAFTHCWQINHHAHLHILYLAACKGQGLNQQPSPSEPQLESSSLRSSTRRVGEPGP